MSFISALRSLPCSVFATTILVGVSVSTNSGPLLAEDLDVDKFFEAIQKAPVSNVDPEQVRQSLRKREDAKRRAETEQVMDSLQRGKNRWNDLVDKLDNELHVVADRAERDAAVRAWATVFQLIGMAAALATEMTSDPSSETTASADPGTPGTPTPETPTPKDGLQLRERYERTIKLCDGGVCETIDMWEYINEAVRPASHLKDAECRQLHNKISQASSVLPSMRFDRGGELGDSVQVTILGGPVLSPSTVGRLGSSTTTMSAAHSEERVVEASLGKLGVVAARKVVKYVKDAAKVLKNNRGGGRRPVKPFGDKETVAQIIAKTGKHGITRVDLPKGSPGWNNFQKMSWKQIKEGADQGKLGYAKVKNLLQGGRYDKTQKRR